MFIIKKGGFKTLSNSWVRIGYRKIMIDRQEYVWNDDGGSRETNNQEADMKSYDYKARNTDTRDRERADIKEKAVEKKLKRKSDT